MSILLSKYRVQLLLFLIIAISFGLKFHRLEFPQSYYFDEVYFAFTAQEMAKGNKSAWQVPEVEAPKDLAYEWTHPPLGKEISSLGILIFGDNTFGWRFFQAFFGVLGTLFIFLLGRNLFNNGVGLIAALLYTFESFIFVLSRITMVDIFMANFVLLASLFVVKYAKSRKTIFLLLTGLFCGASISIKWSGVYIAEFLAGVSFFLIYYFEVYSSDSEGSSYISALLRVFPRMILAFVLIPLIIYVATYIPFFYFGNSIGDFIALQGQMFGYHGGVTDTHPYQSQWWMWPLLIKTVYMHFEKLGGQYAHIYALGNPFIWWTGCVFFLAGVVQVIRKESPALIFAVVSVLAYWLPWALSPRKVTFLYHFLPALLFVIIIIAYFLNSIWNKSKYGKFIVVMYIMTAIGVFIYFYPIIAAVPISPDTVDRYFWLQSWR
ncbi:MAG: phospholipid carrier-dependent glycosyltransferase [Thermodesulfobacteriota bacterium]